MMRNGLDIFLNIKSLKSLRSLRCAASRAASETSVQFLGFVSVTPIDAFETISCATARRPAIGANRQAAEKMMALVPTIARQRCRSRLRADTILGIVLLVAVERNRQLGRTRHAEQGVVTSGSSVGKPAALPHR